MIVEKVVYRGVRISSKCSTIPSYIYASPRQESMVDGGGIEPPASSLRTMRSPS
jgi:hypothetical protein